MFLWRISIFVKTPAMSLGTVRAPDEATARQTSIEFFRIPPEQQFRVVAVKVEEAKKARAKA